MPKIFASARQRGVHFRHTALYESAVSPILTSVHLRDLLYTNSLRNLLWAFPSTLLPVTPYAISTVAQIYPKGPYPGRRANLNPHCTARKDPPDWIRKPTDSPRTKPPRSEGLKAPLIFCQNPLPGKTAIRDSSDTNSSRKPQRRRRIHGCTPTPSNCNLSPRPKRKSTRAPFPRSQLCPSGCF